MTPLRFDADGASLYGVLHPAVAGARAGRAVLLCNPFGQEAVRSHRVYRVLADRFARAGFATLRFDYFGTGDSEGDDEDVSLERWIGDVHAADAELRRLTGCGSVAWMGLRLGATVAALASYGSPEPVERLVLWDAVVDGRAWLASLSEDHEAALQRAFFNASDHAPAVVDQERLDEAIGFALPEPFRRSARALDERALLGLRCARLHWLASIRSPPSEYLKNGLNGRARSTHWNEVADTDWNTDEAMNASIVPADVLALAQAALEAS